MENKKPILSFTCFKDSAAETFMNGTCFDITKSVIFLLNIIYNNFHANSAGRAEIFKSIIKGCVNDENSPMWKLDEDQAGKDSRENS